MNSFKKLSNPILVVGDQPAALGGLSRIARDLAMLLCTMPQYRVGYLARGCGNTRRFPFTMYSFPEDSMWGQNHIEAIWRDFSAGEPGIILTTDDLSRRGWFANPQMYGPMASFLGEGRSFKKFGYTPVDSVGPDLQGLGVEARMTAMGYDRLLAASEFGRDTLIRSGRRDADYLPHGIDQKIFSIDPQAHEKLGWDRDDVHVGFFAANQPRKDFPVAFETAMHLKQKYGNRFRFHVHTNAMIHGWNIYSLAMDYGINDCLDVTIEKTDAELALRYSACDCTILPSGGEGFSYTTAESLSCGTPQIVADYAAAPELVEEDCRVKPVAFRVDTQFNVQRAVLSGWGFASAAYGQIEKKRQDREFRGEELRESVIHLGWDKLKHPWLKWFESGLRD